MDIPELPEFLIKKRSGQVVKETALKLRNPPIIEAVVDIDCDLRPTMNLAALESDARKMFADQYPRNQQQHIQKAQIEHRANELPKTSLRQTLQALQFLKDDSLQLVQVRTNGFSFNRLAPYGSLDDYLPEIRRTWELFLDLAKPLQVRKVGLRYINRIFLPTTDGRLEFDDFLKIGPHLPDEEGMTFGGFVHQHSAIEIATGNRVNTVLMSQTLENNRLPLIFDIEALRNVNIEPNNWDEIAAVISSLRNLKNRVFANTLSERCLKLFQPLE